MNILAIKAFGVHQIGRDHGNQDTILHNIKLIWISTKFMFNIVKGVLVKYHTLFMRMTLDTSTLPNVRSNLFLFIDVKTLLGLNVVMLLLDAMQSLIKFT
jgi:hypothetical protein